MKKLVSSLLAATALAVTAMIGFTKQVSPRPPQAHPRELHRAL